MTVAVRLTVRSEELVKLVFSILILEAKIYWQHKQRWNQYFWHQRLVIDFFNGPVLHRVTPVKTLTMTMALGFLAIS